MQKYVILAVLLRTDLDLQFSGRAAALQLESVSLGCMNVCNACTYVCVQRLIL